VVLLLRPPAAGPQSKTFCAWISVSVSRSLAHLSLYPPPLRRPVVYVCVERMQVPCRSTACASSPSRRPHSFSRSLSRSRSFACSLFLSLALSLALSFARAPSLSLTLFLCLVLSRCLTGARGHGAGKIVSAEQHPDSDSLYVEQIDVGDPEGPRTIVSGLAKYIPLAELPGRMCTVLCNLKPAKMRGVESGGMVLCGANEAQNTVQLLEPPPGAKVGERIVIDGYDAPDPDVVLKSKTQQKVWPAVAPDLKANAEGLATYKGSLLQTSAGPLKCSSLTDCLIG